MNCRNLFIFFTIKGGSVTPEEIADVLDTEELPVKAEANWSVGE